MDQDNTYRITVTIQPNIDNIGIERKRKRETRIKRWTYTRTMSDNIADHHYRYSERKRETNTIQRRISTYNE